MKKLTFHLFAVIVFITISQTLLSNLANAIKATDNQPENKSFVNLEHGLVAYFPYTESASSMVGSLGGNIIGLSSDNDRFGNYHGAFYFNGNASASYTLFNIPQERTTLALWVKVLQCDENQVIISKYLDNENIELLIREENCRYSAEWTIDGCSFKLTDNTGLNIIDQQNPKFDCIILRYDGQQAALYINGNKADSFDISGYIANIDVPLIVGKSDQFIGEELTGTIDEFRIYNRALNEAEIHAFSNDSIVTVPKVGCCVFYTTKNTAFAEPVVLVSGNSKILELGITWGTTPNFDSTKNRVPVDSASNTFLDGPTSIIKELEANTTYYIKGYAINSEGIAYSPETSFTTLRNPDLQSGLVAYYPLDDNAKDVSGNGHDGTANGTTLSNDRYEKPNLAYEFNGAKNTLAFKGFEVPEHSFTYAVACWLKITDSNADTVFQNFSPKSFRVLLRIVNQKYQLEIFILGNKYIISDDEGYFEIDPEHPRYDFLILYLNMNTLHFQINHQIIGTLNTNLKPLNNIFPLTMQNDISYSIKGIVDDIRIFNRDLYWEDIEAMYTDRKVTIPIVTTDSVSDIARNAATVYGTRKYYGGSILNETGVCWSTLPNPDTTYRTKSSFWGINDFTSKLTNLLSGTTYYVRSYSINSAGVGYGNTITFTTHPPISYGSLIDVDGNVYKTVKIGTQTWMAENLKTTKYADGTPIEFGTHIYQNDPNNKLTYGLLYTWSAATKGKECKIDTQRIQGVCPTGWHIPSYGEQAALIEYLGGKKVAGGKLKEAGNEHWKRPNSGATNESGFSALGAGLNYFVNWNMIDTFQKALTHFWNTACEEGFEFNYAYGLGVSNTSSWAGIGQNLSSNGGSVRCIKDTSITYEQIPLLRTDTILNITHNFALVKGSLNISGSSPILFGGVCWDTIPYPDTTDFKTIEIGNFPLFRNNILTRLHPNTTYYVRAYAVNLAGVGYGNELIFTTKPDLIERGTVQDIEGNIYETVRIGNQNWMAENLKTTTLNDGTPIELVLSDLNGSEWLRFNQPAYSFLFDNIKNMEIYGASYNFKAVLTEKICPNGWHVPSNEEWNELKNFLGDSVGNKLKEAGFEHWRKYPDSEASNSSGFTGLPGGVRMSYGRFYDYIGGWWSNYNSSYWYVNTNDAYLSHGQDATGASIRCLEDSGGEVNNNKLYTFGDIDSNNQIQSTDASLVLQYSVGLDPLPSIDPLPWEEVRIVAADVDKLNGITAYDASLILQYEAGLIKSFPADDDKKSFSTSQADMEIGLENGFVTFRPNGKLYGLNLNISGASDMLGMPLVLNSNVLLASHVTSESYSVGLAAAVAPEEKAVVMKIPLTRISGKQVTVEMTINNVTKNYILGSPTSVQQNSLKALDIFPNPANSKLYFGHFSGKVFIEIYNLQGKAVIKQVVDSEADISSLPNGTYIIIIRDTSNTVTRKFVKQD